MFKSVMWFGGCTTLVVAPAVAAGAGFPVTPGVQFLLAGVGVAGAVGGAAIAAVVKLYVRTRANEAFVRTGSGGAKVILDGGTTVIPVLHEIVRVPLETMRLDVDRTGHDALITADKLRADLKAEFYIRVQPNREDVLNAARSLGEKTFDLRAIEELVKDKLISTLRAVAATRTLDELNAKRDEFAAEVKKAVEADLRHNGLTLETVTVSKLDQTDTKLLNPNNVFDAQGLKRIAEITQAALVDRNRIEREAERSRTEKDVETRQLVLELERKRAEAEALQRSQVAMIQAEREADAQRSKIEQDQGVAQREVEKVRAIQQSQLEAEQQILTARRARELTEVERSQAVEMAEREKLIAVSAAEMRRAEAEQLRLAAEAERARSEQAVRTVEVTAAAERDGEQKLIAAKKAAEQDRYRKQVDADVAAYAITKQAEAKKAAAEAEFLAKTRQAEGDAESARMRAEGETAQQMVPVNVARRQVEVDEARVVVEKQRVDVEAQSLSNREQFGKAALDFEIGKLQLETHRDTQVAIAKALGEFLAKSNFTMFGDPESAQKMVDGFFRGMGLGRTVDGFLAGTSPEGQAVIGAAGSNAMGMLKAIAERVAGRPIDPAELEKAVDAAKMAAAPKPSGDSGGAKRAA